MKPPVKKMLITTGLICGLAVFVAANARASLVINYDGDYITEFRDFVLPSSVDPSGNLRTWKYSDSTPITPGPGNYTGPAVYGGFQSQPGSGGAVDLAWVTGLYDPTFQPLANTKLMASVPGGNSTITAMFAFKPTVGPNQTVSFNGSSAINYYVSAATEGGRFVLKNAGSWYISNNTLTLGAAGNLTGSNLSNSTWASFSPENVAPLPTIPASGYTFLGSSFEDIQSVGIYFHGTRPGGNQPYVALGRFTLDAAVVPEPAAMSLLLGAGGLLLAVRRHRLRRPI